VSFCPKCGNKITEDMAFCPKCGAPLNVEQATRPERPPTYRHEKEEKREKGGEKREKREKHEYAFIGPLIGGLILVFVGLSAYLSVAETDERTRGMLWAVFFIVIGVLILVAIAYGAVVASRRHPRT
jgi:uncharacterized membrane protein YvbJ